MASPLELILHSPETYIGPVEKRTEKLWVYHEDEDQMVQRPVTYVPGLFKIFDEILVGAAYDKQWSDSKKKTLNVSIDDDCIGFIGAAIPFDINEGGDYAPELLFGRLPAIDEDESDWYWIRLANVFSTEFVIEIAHGLRKYKQVFSNNMRTISKPSISKCRPTENWTKITFKPDLAKFSMTCLEEDDVVALMKKRVIDVAACFGNIVKVKLNGKRIQFRSFSKYCGLYLKSLAGGSEPLPSLEEYVHEKWQICISRSTGQFQQVSFVNGIATHKGGTHVTYVSKKIGSHLVNVLNNMKSRTIEVEIPNVLKYVWVFVTALIDDPMFDNETKKTLTLPLVNLGSSWDFTPKFLDRVARSSIMQNVQEWAESRDVAQSESVLEHFEADQWGKKDAAQCTLILTEGDSTKALAIAGVKGIGSTHYGVLSLTGRLLNVREASHTQVMQNVEITKIKQILGLKHGVEYVDAKSLNYGHVMIMTDQDHNGSQYKGLLINLFHYFWPSLLKVPGFLSVFITPIVKVEHKNGIRKIAFYSMPQYESWKERLGTEAKHWTINYYKGLGSCTKEEMKEYFRNLENHKRDFVWEDDEDDKAIKLAFSKKKTEARKSWLQQYDPDKFLDIAKGNIKFHDFVHKELISFAIIDLKRAIPSIVDGLKSGQRKVLFCSFKRNFDEKATVGELCGYALAHSGYPHGEQMLIGTIIGMAQDFVGSNNINLLLPIGSFGTRLKGGKDHASPKNIYTQLAPVTRFLFPKEDDILLNYLDENGKSIEPTWYMPIIPMILVNGCEGIGTGWSTYVPSYNPLDIIQYIRSLMKGQRGKKLHPWYKGFVGSIEKNMDDPGCYICQGVIEEVDKNNIRISELPIRTWTQDYKEFLYTVSNDRSTDPFIKKFCDKSCEDVVDFSICIPEERLRAVEQEVLVKKLKLSTSISTTNMHLFDSEGRIQKYNTPEDILVEFYHLRLELYEKRKNTLLAILEKEADKCFNKYKYIKGVMDGSINFNGRKRADLYPVLEAQGLKSFPCEGYDYLLDLPSGDLTSEKMNEWFEEMKKHQEELDVFANLSAKKLWERDLDVLEAKLDGIQKISQVKKLKGKAEKQPLARAAVGRPKRADEPPAPAALAGPAVGRPERANEPPAPRPKRARANEPPAPPTLARPAVGQSERGNEPPAPGAPARTKRVRRDMLL